MPRTLVVLSPRLGAVLPVAAVPALRAAERVYADPDVPEELRVAAGAEPTPGTYAYSPLCREVRLTTNAEHPMRPHAESVIETPEPTGSALLDAVAVMDRLRSPGGCPWDAEQTHSSLLRYLVEECYELYQAVEDVDRPALREELGDVLLQVLFHARVATEGGVEPWPADGDGGVDPARFGIDEVAADLVTKLVSRHPHVFPSGDSGEPAERLLTASDQERRWEELKKVEKRRESALDGVALAQPAAALAAKLVSRAGRAGLPPELAEAGGDELFAQVARAAIAGEDPEQRLRGAARRFARDVRAAEAAARAAGLDPHALRGDQWRALWPR